MTQANGNGYISGRTMTIIMSASGLIMLAAGGFLSFQNATSDRRLSELREEVIKNRDGLAAIVPTVAERGREVFRIDQNNQRIEAALLRSDAGIVTRKEHEGVWGSFNKDITNLQRQMDDMRKEVGSSYTLGDKIKELQRQLDEIRNKSPAAK